MALIRNNKIKNHILNNTSKYIEDIELEKERVRFSEFLKSKNYYLLSELLGCDNTGNNKII